MQKFDKSLAELIFFAYFCAAGEECIITDARAVARSFAGILEEISKKTASEEC